MSRNSPPPRSLQIITTADRNPAVDDKDPAIQTGLEPAARGLNPYALLIQNAKSPDTKRTYAANLRRFFREVYDAPENNALENDASENADPELALVRRFLSQSAPEIAMMLAQHRDALTEAGKSAATINLRLAAVRSLIDIAHKFRMCEIDSKGLILSLKTQAYRDTRGPGMENMKRLLALPDKNTLRGKRDVALLRLLADNGLRRFEVCRLSVSHFDPGGRRLSIMGKRRDEREWVTLHPSTRDAIAHYLAEAGHTDGALFRNCAHRLSARGQALLEDGLDDIVRSYGKQIGLTSLSCHKFRHFAITALLDATGGDMRRVQKFSRHKNINILSIYDDNRTDHQGELTQLLGDLLES